MSIRSKLIFYTIVFFVLIFATDLVAQTGYQPDSLVKKNITGMQIDLASITIKDNDGEILDVATVVQRLQSGEYIMESYVDARDQIKEMVLRPNQSGRTITTWTQQDSDTVRNVDPALREELEQIRVKDQLLRMLVMRGGCIETTYGVDSEEYRYIYALINQEDKKNQEQVIQIIDENGWPGISQVGFFANNAVFLVIQHASLDIQEKYFPLLKESVEKGESQPADMALMDDRIRMRNNMKQLYGSQAVTRNGKLYVWPIEDPQNVDERRKSVQLPSLAEYLKSMDLSYPQDELPSELF